MRKVPTEKKEKETRDVLSDSLTVHPRDVKETCGVYKTNRRLLTRAVRVSVGGVSLAAGWGRSGKPGVLMWQPESYLSYRKFRRVLPAETALLLSPEFLFPAMSAYDTLGRRLTESGLAWSGRQAAPDVLVGTLFLLQVCTNVNVYGVDPSYADAENKKKRGFGDVAGGPGGAGGGGTGDGGAVARSWRRRYYSRATRDGRGKGTRHKATRGTGGRGADEEEVEEEEEVGGGGGGGVYGQTVSGGRGDARERDVEYGALRALHARRVITLCPTEHAPRCAQMTPRNARGVIVRSGVKW